MRFIEDTKIEFDYYISPEGIIDRFSTPHIGHFIQWGTTVQWKGDEIYNVVSIALVEDEFGNIYEVKPSSLRIYIKPNTQPENDKNEDISLPGY